MAREKEIPADVWARTCDLYFKQRRAPDDIVPILWREYKFKISRVTLNKRLNEIKATFVEEDVGVNAKTIAGDRRHAARMRRAVLGELDPTQLTNKEKLQHMLDDTFVAFQMAKKDNDTKKMDICLTSFARGTLAIAALERMGLENGGLNGNPAPLPGVKIGSKQLGAHHERDTGALSIDPRSDAIDITYGASVPTEQPKLEQSLHLATSLVGNGSMPGVSLGEATAIADSVMKEDTEEKIG